MKPTATLLTPRGRGAVASLRVDGDAADVLDTYFTAANGHRAEQQQVGRIAFGTWGGDEFREEVVLCRVSEQSVEIHCHGGTACVERILDDLAKGGAHLSSQEDSPLGEVHQAVTRAMTLRTAAILLRQTRLWAAWLDRAKTLDDCGTIAAEVTAILDWQTFGFHLTEPWQVAIVGPPNVGKSTLLNAILGFERSIVFDQPGTTRDVVSARTVVDGWPIVFSDTAGIREATDGIERAGISAAMARADEADLRIEVADLSATNAAARTQGPGIIRVGNKADTVPSDQNGAVDIALSALTGDGVETLLDRVAAELVPEVPEDVCVPVGKHQVNWLREILASCERDELSNVQQLLAQA